MKNGKDIYGAMTEPKTTFHSIADMNTWLNKRVSRRGESIDFDILSACSMPHGSVPVKRILGEDDSIYLVDWGYAGLCPRFFEVATISCWNSDNPPYGDPLMEATQNVLKLTEKEKHLIRLMHVARTAILRYFLYVPSAKDEFKFDNSPNALAVMKMEMATECVVARVCYTKINN